MRITRIIILCASVVNKKIRVIREIRVRLFLTCNCHVFVFEHEFRMRITRIKILPASVVKNKAARLP